MTMKMMISALLVTCAITLSSSQNLTNDDITSICKAVTEQGNCSSCNWCSVRKDGFPLTVKELCRVDNWSLALSDFPCSNITTFYSQSCSAGTLPWAHTVVCPIAESATSCFVTTEASTTTVTTTTATTTTVPTTTKTIRFQAGAPETFPEASTTTVTTTTATTTTVPTTTKTIRFQAGAPETFPEATTTVPTTTATTMPSIPGPDVARKTFRTPCTQRCVRNDIVASVCGSSTLADECTKLEVPTLDGKYTCCTG